MKNIIDIRSKNLIMERNRYQYHLQLFRKDKMVVDCLVYFEDKFIKKESIPYAQLTKKLKKILH